MTDDPISNFADISKGLGTLALGIAALRKAFTDMDGGNTALPVVPPETLIRIADLLAKQVDLLRHLVEANTKTGEIAMRADQVALTLATALGPNLSEGDRERLANLVAIDPQADGDGGDEGDPGER